MSAKSVQSKTVKQMPCYTSSMVLVVPAHVATVPSALFMGAVLGDGVRLMGADTTAVIAKGKARTRAGLPNSLCHLKMFLLSPSLLLLQSNDP